MPRPVRGGGVLDYTLTLRDAGTRAAELRLPDAVDVIGTSDPGCTEVARGGAASGSGRVVRCSFSGGSRPRSVHILGIVRPGASGVLRATARLAGRSERVARDGTAEVGVPVTPGTDVAVRLVTPRKGRPGNVVPVRATVTDRGPRPARRVTLSVGAQGAVVVRMAGAHCRVLRRARPGWYIRCLLGRLRPGHARTVTAYLRRGRGRATLAASAGHDLGDTGPADDAAAVTLR
ncbi:COG1361 family protein [Actinomadura logoneensis]|uniref:hypothetical protein n=1 Tax=Actinomadura logoneensis TaxID=2293572 RepID=UPI0011C110E4|nr:hypothetical protein [Actinomadura logoneensis]